MSKQKDRRRAAPFAGLRENEKAPVDMTAIRKAITEDSPQGDLTSKYTVPPKAIATATLYAKGDLVVAGLDYFKAVCEQVDPALDVSVIAAEGANANKGDILARVSGKARAILLAERVALNYAIRACSVATLTAKYVRAVEGTRARILDTRKTTPGLRDLEKYAVRVGGGLSHRRNLSAMVLIKENHIAIAGGIGDAVFMAQEGEEDEGYVEVEVKNLKELSEAIEAYADIALLDNMSPKMIKEAVKLAKGQIWLEASGNMTLQKAKQAAQTGVDFISVGALTHSAPAVDISLLVETDMDRRQQP